MITKKYLTDNGYKSIEEVFAEMVNTGNMGLVEKMSKRQKNLFDQFVPEEPKIIQDLKAQGYIPIVWHKNDIRMAMREVIGEVDNILVDEVCARLVENFDANKGINWETIKSEIHED